MATFEVGYSYHQTFGRTPRYAGWRLEEGVKRDSKFVFSITPQKFNIDTQNGHIQKEIHFPCVSMLVFGGVYTSAAWISSTTHEIHS